MRVELRVRLLTDEGEKTFGEGPYRLLRGVERLGSLRAAAIEQGMAYSKANRIMGRAERLLGAPLTRRRIGGPDGGGSALTPLAQELLARYETFRADCEAAAKASFARNFGDLSVTVESANDFPLASPNQPSGDSSFAAGAQERCCGESECAIAARGMATAGDCFSRSSGDLSFAAEAQEQCSGESECAVAVRGAATAGDCVTRNSGDSPFAAEAKERRTGETERAIAVQGAAGEECFARSFGDAFSTATGVANDADCLQQGKPSCPFSDSSLEARKVAARGLSRCPDEASSTAPSCSQSVPEDCEQPAVKSVLAAQEAMARESHCHSGEASSTVPSCSRLVSKNCEQPAGKSVLAAQEAMARESHCHSDEISSPAPSCSRFVPEDCERPAGKSALTAQEAMARGSHCHSGETSSTAPSCSRSVPENCERHASKSALAAQGAMARESYCHSGEAFSAASNGLRFAAKDCERHAGEPLLADVEQPAACESFRHSGEIPTGLGCVVLAAGRARRFGGGKLLAELNGRAVLARTLEALPRGCFCRIAVVTSDPAVSALCRGLGFPVREYPGGALSDSIREGLAEMNGTGGCMFVNGDQPLLRPDSLRRLANAFEDDPIRVYRLAHGGIAASPVVFPASAYPALRALTGESGGMAALKGGIWEIRTVEAEDESELWDVDDPAALKRAEVRLREDLQG